jgi:hypothetical protein
MLTLKNTDSAITASVIGLPLGGRRLEVRW